MAIKQAKLPKGTRRTMSDQITTVNEDAMKTGLSELVRTTVQQVVNSMLGEEAAELVGAERYGCAAGGREACRSGHHKRRFAATSSEIEPEMPKLRNMRFGMAILERHKRRETSVEEAMIERCSGWRVRWAHRRRQRDTMGFEGLRVNGVESE